jgi:hypothetical protein
LKNWRSDKQYEWLNNNPIKNKIDVAWLREEVATYHSKINEYIKEKEKQGTPKPVFKGLQVKLRFIMALIATEQIKSAYFERDCVLSHQEIEAKQSFAPPPTLWVLVAEKFNDPKWNPVSPDYSDWSDQLKPMDCSYKKCVDGTILSANKAKGHFVNLCSSFVDAFVNHAASGNVDGQLINQNNPDDSDDGDQFFGGDNHVNFVKGRMEVLFFWRQLLNLNQEWVSSSLTILSKNYKAMTEKAPECSNPKKIKRSAKENVYQEKVSNAMDVIASAATCQVQIQHINTLQKQSTEYAKQKTNIMKMLFNFMMQLTKIKTKDGQKLS